MSGLYLHIPFCRRKCPYCDFFSTPTTNSQLTAYPELLIQHLAWSANQGWTGPFDSVYFGGGTPSLLSPAAVKNILQSIRHHFGLTNVAEISIEANPGTVTQQTLDGYRGAGANRLSLGLQSCNDRQLSGLGRLHNRQQGIDACRWAREAGFDNLSLDLMFALPEQTTASLDDDLHAYIDLAPEHLSCYGLTAEPHTPLHQQIASGEISLPDEDFYADAFMMIHERLADAGYNHYEIANYARPGSECRHNLAYWQRQSFLGIGAGAHSFCSKHWGSRREVPPDLFAYQRALQNGHEPSQPLESFDHTSALRETVYLALRMQQGISDRELQQRFGCTLQDAFAEAIAKSTPWLRNNNGCWSFTPAGWLLFDRLILPFL